MSQYFFKDPNATLDYTWDWATWLGTDTIASFTLSVPDGVTLATSSNSTTAVTAWFSGGMLGAQYDVVCRITTAAGRINDATISLVVQDT